MDDKPEPRKDQSSIRTTRALTTHILAECKRRGISQTQWWNEAAELKKRIELAAKGTGA